MGTPFEYAPAPESRDVVNLKSSYGLFIDGEFVDPVDGSAFKTLNPANEEVLAEVSEAGDADVDRAVAAAREAFDKGPFPGWSPEERADGISRLSEALKKRGQEIATTIASENGCPIAIT